MRNAAFASFLKKQRKQTGLTRLQLASLAKMDPSYITLMERDGYVPRKDKVIEVAIALKVDRDQLLLMAGYAPEGISVAELLEGLHASKEARLTADQRALIAAVREVSPAELKRIVRFVEAYASSLPESTRRREEVEA